MTTNEIISIASISISTIVAIVTFIKSTQWNEEKESLRSSTTYAQLEIMTQTRIASSRDKITHIGIEIAKNESDLNKRSGLFKDLLIEGVEELLNSYEEACKRYFENQKVDKKAFVSEYAFQVHDLFSKEGLKEVVEKGGENEYPFIYRFNREMKETKK